MAGFYPDVPAPRMAYDRDGTVGFVHTGSIPTQLSLAQLQALNDDSTSQYDSGIRASVYFGVIFPQLRDVAGYYISRNDNIRVMTIQTSVDTSNGLDGNWVSIGGNGTQVGSGGAPDYRTGIQGVNWAGIKSVRVLVSGDDGGTVRPRGFHLYGNLSAAESPDRMRLWHPTLDEPLDDNTAADGAWLDWGDVIRGTSADKTFRIKNNSSSLTAQSIVISPDILTDTTPTVSSQMTFSDGGSFASSINIGNLAPGAISPVITMRRSTLSNATLSLWTGRISINPGSWS